MEIKGLESFLNGVDKNDKAIRIGEILEKAKEQGASLSIIAKSLILTYLEFDYAKHLELKNKYLNEVVKPIENKNTDGFSKDQLKRIKQMHELEIEILKAKIEVVNKKMEE